MPSHNRNRSFFFYHDSRMITNQVFPFDPWTGFEINGRTDGRRDKAKPVYPPLLRSGGIIKKELTYTGGKVYI